MGGIRRQDLTPRSGVTRGWEGSCEKASFNLPSRWEHVRGRLETGPGKARTTSGCLNDNQQAVGLGDHWSHHQCRQESGYDMVGSYAASWLQWFAQGW